MAEWPLVRPFTVNARIAKLVTTDCVGPFCLFSRGRGTLNINLCNGQRGLDGTPFYVWFAPRSEQHYTLWEFTVPNLPPQACVALVASATIQSDDIFREGSFCFSARSDVCMASQDVDGSKS